MPRPGPDGILGGRPPKPNCSNGMAGSSRNSSFPETALGIGHLADRRYQNQVRGRQQGGFTDLATDLHNKPSRKGLLAAFQRRDQSSALRHADIDRRTCLTVDQLLQGRPIGQAFVRHDALSGFLTRRARPSMSSAGSGCS